VTARRALVSVSDKGGLALFARGLTDLGFEILSTGGTAKALRAEGIAVRDVSEVTSFPECLDGRVKTLHPRIHGGILARDTEAHRAELASIGGTFIDLVVVNLYPFEKTVARPDVAPHDAIENIDIGGPSMVRSAAKNHERVGIVCDPADYEPVLTELRAHAGTLSPTTRTRLAAKAFAHTAAYDAAIAGWMAERAGTQDDFPETLVLRYVRGQSLRYGENPHQKAALYRDAGAPASIAHATVLGGGELSYNNLLDAEGAWECVASWPGDAPVAVVIKHTNPCGFARAASLQAAYVLAREGDPVSAFGGIVGLSRRVDRATAEALAETFLEVVVAPGFDPDAIETLARKKSLRLLAVGEGLRPARARAITQISGGLLVQDADRDPDDLSPARVVTKRAPTDAERRALGLAWHVCRHVKSNAIVFAAGDSVVGVGAGQMSRVDSVEIAVKKAGARAKGAVLASDAFFPFRDGPDAALRAGIVAIAQPGGSKRDDETIAAADEAGAAMIFTGRRHFRHT